MRRILLSVLFVLVASPVWAQVQPNTSYRVTVYPQGGTTLTTVYNIPAAEVTCNSNPLPPVPSGVVANPSTLAFTNPDTNLNCVWVQSGSNPIFSLPVGAATYDTALTAINPAGASAESARSNPFSVPGSVPATPTNLRIYRP